MKVGFSCSFSSFLGKFLSSIFYIIKNNFENFVLSFQEYPVEFFFLSFFLFFFFLGEFTVGGRKSRFGRENGNDDGLDYANGNT